MTLNNWTKPSDLRTQVQKLWDKGDILASFVTNEPLFPKRFSLKTPTSTEMTAQFDAVRAWIAALNAMAYFRFGQREFKHRVFGTNAIPAEAWLDSVDAAVGLIGKRREVISFKALVDMTAQQQPQLLDWLAKRPLRALELVDEWPRLLNIIAWLVNHPRPNIYLRQIDLSGIHSKFIESHRNVLSELLDIVLPPEAIDVSVFGVNQFCKRYGFSDKPARIRFRVLDPNNTPFPNLVMPDITLDVASFALLKYSGQRVFITENEINFLAFPAMANSLVIFGAGYGFDGLREAKWLNDCRLYYWGDIDTHGFAILDQLRAQFGQVESVLMDRSTLQAHEQLWGEEDKQTIRDLTRLNAHEQALYDDLRDNCIRKNLRLEQERIGFAWVVAALEKTI